MTPLPFEEAVKHLKHGDLKFIANQLNMSRQYVSDVKHGEYDSPLVRESIIALGTKRKNEMDAIIRTKILQEN